MAKGLINGVLAGTVVSAVLAVAGSVALPERVDLDRNVVPGLARDAGSSPAEPAGDGAASPETRRPDAPRVPLSRGAEAPVVAGAGSEGDAAPSGPSAPSALSAPSAPGATEMLVPAGSEFGRGRDDFSPRAPQGETAFRPETTAETVAEASLPTQPRPETDAGTAPRAGQEVVARATAPAAEAEAPAAPAAALRPEAGPPGTSRPAAPSRPTLETAAEPLPRPLAAGPLLRGADTPLTAPPPPAAETAAPPMLPRDDAGTPETARDRARSPDGRSVSAEPDPVIPEAEGDAAAGPSLRPVAPLSPPPRLPLSGTSRPAAQAASGGEPAGTEGAEDDRGALARFAVPFDAGDPRPLMSVVLVHEGAGVDGEMLDLLTFPVTFAVDPALPDAAEIARRYREAGHEVLMLTPRLRRGMNAAEVAEAFSRASADLPGAVGLLDRPAGGVQNDRRLFDRLLRQLAEGGFGLLLYDRGLNDATRQAADRAVPAAEVFRLLDAQNERWTVIKRYLDRAAFKAAKEGRVVMLGRTTPETLRGLAEWALDDSAGGVALAPVSAIMQLP